MAFKKTFEYTVAVKGYHYLETICQPKENEMLVCQFENGSSYDMFAIRTCDQIEAIVGYLPHEVSSIAKVFNDCSATLSFMLMGTHYLRSPLVKGGLTIPYKVSVSMPRTCLNFFLLKR